MEPALQSLVLLTWQQQCSSQHLPSPSLLLMSEDVLGRSLLQLLLSPLLFARASPTESAVPTQEELTVS